jgi:hypothetical protein
MQDTGDLDYNTDSGVTITGMKAQVDFVKTVDGKTYGADPNRMGKTLRFGEFSRRSERKRLLQIYNSGGLSALLNELQR